MDDINEVAFGAQVDSLRILLQRRYHDLNSVTLCDISKVFQDIKHISRLLFSELVNVLKLELVMSATNATSERSFSALRRLKTYLRSTMTQERLSHLMILHVHKETTDIMNLETVANESVVWNTVFPFSASSEWSCFDYSTKCAYSCI